MRLSVRRTLTSICFCTASAPLLAMPHLHRGPTSPRFAKSHRAAKVATPRTISSVGIAPARATQIQSALVKAGYLTGDPSGVWDSSTQAAMVKLQGDNGWQTKLVPDSRAIIKLGLGPGSAVGGEAAVSEPRSMSAGVTTPEE